MGDGGGAAVRVVRLRGGQPRPGARYPTTQDLVSALDRLTPDGHIRSDVHEVIVIKSRPAFRGLLADAVPGFPPPKHYNDLDF